MTRRRAILRQAAECAAFRAERMVPVCDVCGLGSIPHVGDFSEQGDAVAIAEVRGLVNEGHVVLGSAAGSGRLDRMAVTPQGLELVAGWEKSWSRKCSRWIDGAMLRLAKILSGGDRLVAWDAGR